MFARTSSIDYEEILKKVSHFKHLHSHFSNMKKTKQGNHTDIHVPIDNAPPFKPLAEQLIKHKTNISIISESPLIEMDALKMKHILESLGYKF
jgi:deoxyribonuclease-4